MLKSDFSNIKAIFFDVDEVIIKGQDEDGNFLWVKNIYDDLGIHQKEIPKLFNHKWHDVLLGKTDTLHRISEFLSEIGSKISANDFLAYWLKNDAKIDKQMLDFAKKLKEYGYRLYLATNQDKYRAKHLCETLGLKDMFDDIFASSLVGYKKPDSSYFKELEQKVGLMSDEILFIDDSLENVNSAINCGWMGYQHYNYTRTKDYLLEVNFE